MFDQLTEWVTDVVTTLGYGGVAFLVALENIFPPIPSEVVLPLAGFVAGRGDAALPGMIVAATIGSVVGAWALYLIAAAIGRARLHWLVGRYGRWFRIEVADLERAEGWFDRRGGTAVLICRCVPLIRSLVSIPAGFRRMAPVRFTVLTTIGSLAWNTALIVAGYLLGERWDEVGDYVSYLQYALYVAVAGAVAWFLWRRFLSPTARAQRSDATR